MTEKKQRDLMDFLAEQAKVSPVLNPQQPQAASAGNPQPPRRITAQEPPAWKRMATTGVVVAVLAGVGILGWRAVGSGTPAPADGPLPVVKAETAPYKTEPKDPGGMEVPDRDKMVFNATSPQGGHQEAIDVAKAKLAPQPEEPVSRDTITQLAGATPSSGTPEIPAATPAEPAALTSDTPAPAAIPAAPEAVAEPAPVTEAAPEATPPKKPAINVIKVAPSTPLGTAEETAPKGKKSAAPKAAIKTAPASGPFRLQLGAFRTEQSLQAVWDQAKKDLPEISKLEHSVEKADLGDRGIFYRLYAGPVADQSTAQSLCNKLKAHKRGCILAH